MRCALGCIAAALLASALLPASALGAAAIVVESNLPLVRVVGDAAAAVDRINVEETTSFYIISREGGRLTGDGCTDLGLTRGPGSPACARRTRAWPSTSATATTR